jgi:hypothetical protein
MILGMDKKTSINQKPSRHRNPERESYKLLMISLANLTETIAG